MHEGCYNTFLGDSIVAMVIIDYNYHTCPPFMHRYDVKIIAKIVGLHNPDSFIKGTNCE